jgi:hypothetical protein
MAVQSNLPRAKDNSHATARDFFEEFVITQATENRGR